MSNHVSLTFFQLSDSPFGDFCVGVHDGISANTTIFTTIPATATMAMLATATATFQSKIAAANKGSEAQTQARETARTALESIMRILATYVEGVAMGDATKIVAAGFEVTTHGHTAQTVLATPAITGVLNNMTTQLTLRVTAIPNAHSYEVQIRTGTGAWTAAGTFPSTRGIILTNLTPGTMYDIRVRAIGGSTGYSDWSDSVSHMAM